MRSPLFLVLPLLLLLLLLLLGRTNATLAPTVAPTLAPTAAPTPRPTLPLLAPVAQVFARRDSTCTILTPPTSDLRCWGRNNLGQLGQGDTVMRGDSQWEMGSNTSSVDFGTGLTPRANITTDVSGLHSCFVLDPDGSAKCFGRGAQGQLGYGDANDRGDNPGELGDALPAVDLGTSLPPILQLAQGGLFTCVLFAQHLRIKCWGNNPDGQLGYEDASNRGDGPGEMGDALPFVDLGTGIGAVMLFPGNAHMCARLNDTRQSGLKCWGQNAFGQLGYGDTNNRGDGAGEMGVALPLVNVSSSRLVHVTQGASGASHTCVLLNNSAVKCFGDGANGRLGHGDTVDRGDDPGEMGDALPAVNVLGSATGVQVIRVQCGDAHSCALISDGSVKCWGVGGFGQLGQENTNDIGDDAGEMGDSLPVIKLGQHSVVSASLGYRHSCVRLNDSSAKCFGDNQYGQLGQGDTVNRGDNAGEMGSSLPVVDIGPVVTSAPTPAPTPRPTLPLLAPIAQVLAFDESTCSIQAPPASDLRCWGRSNFGQLGLGDSTSRGGSQWDMGANLSAVDLGTGLKPRPNMTTTSQTEHPCFVLDPGGLVKCFGRGLEGQLGYGDATNRGDNPGELGDALPTVGLGSALPPILQLAQGGYHNCILFAQTSQVKCWGRSSLGELGYEDSNNRGDDAGEMGDALPFVDIGTGLGAVGLIVGGQHTCARLNDTHQGGLKCWGYNFFGQLGYGDISTRGDGVGEMGDTLPFVSLSSSSHVHVVQGHGGFAHTCVLQNDSTVKCFGDGSFGQLGYGDSANRGNNPGEMGDSLPTVDVLGSATGVQVVRVQCGATHSCALISDGSMKCWGSSSSGQLGQGHTNSIGDGAGEMGDALPATQLGGHAVQSVSLGEYHTCARLNHSSVKCFGSNFYGELGQEDTNSRGDGAGEMGSSLPVVDIGPVVTPIPSLAPTAVPTPAPTTVPTPAPTTVPTTIPTFAPSAAPTATPTAVPTRAPSVSTAPTPRPTLPQLAPVAQVITLWESTCTIQSPPASDLRCWGRNNYGQLGLGDSTNRGDSVWQMGANLSAVDLGTGLIPRPNITRSSLSWHVCYVLDPGASVKCFGRGDLGQLGYEEGANRGDSPGELGDALPTVDLGSPFLPVLQLALGGLHSCALFQQHLRIKCWGYNDHGQLGYEDTSHRGDGPGEMGDSLPFVDLGTGLGVMELLVGYFHTCARLNETTGHGGLKCWGRNIDGQLGYGDTSTRGGGAGDMGGALALVNLSSSNYVHIIQGSAGDSHTCVLLNNSAVKCFGAGGNGQLGYGDVDDRGDDPGEMGDLLPEVDVLGSAMAVHVVRVQCGGFHSCALISDGSLKCWGFGFDGQLGQESGNNIGDGVGEMGDALPAIQLAPLAFVQSVSLGRRHSCVRLNDSSVKCFGRNAYGQLGQGDTSPRGDDVGEMGSSLPVVDIGPIVTAVPTPAPTRAPTLVPTQTPTPGPSALPSTPPSIAPSPSPTSVPSALPTGLPTAGPSALPSTPPSIAPSPSPTSVPSALPTGLPTAGPSALPSTPPSIAPSPSPTSVPSALPTGLPTAGPSAMPSVTPTSLPSLAPSPVPSLSVSATHPPTVSLMPTLRPSPAPSLVPTPAPSKFPSVQPSLVPSRSPTTAPTSSTFTAYVRAVAGTGPLPPSGATPLLPSLHAALNHCVQPHFSACELELLPGDHKLSKAYTFEQRASLQLRGNGSSTGTQLLVSADGQVDVRAVGQFRLQSLHVIGATNGSQPVERSLRHERAVFRVSNCTSGSTVEVEDIRLSHASGQMLAFSVADGSTGAAVSVTGVQVTGVRNVVVLAANVGAESRLVQCRQWTVHNATLANASLIDIRHTGVLNASSIGIADVSVSHTTLLSGEPLIRLDTERNATSSIYNLHVRHVSVSSADLVHVRHRRMEPGSKPYRALFVNDTVFHNVTLGSSGGGSGGGHALHFHTPDTDENVDVYVQHSRFERVVSRQSGSPMRLRTLLGHGYVSNVAFNATMSCQAHAIEMHGNLRVEASDVVDVANPTVAAAEDVNCGGGSALELVPVFDLVSNTSNLLVVQDSNFTTHAAYDMLLARTASAETVLLRNNDFPLGTFRLDASAEAVNCPATSTPPYDSLLICDDLATCRDLLGSDPGRGIDCQCEAPFTGDPYTECFIPPGEIRVVPQPLQVGEVTKPLVTQASVSLINVGESNVKFDVWSTAEFCSPLNFNESTSFSLDTGVNKTVCSLLLNQTIHTLLKSGLLYQNDTSTPAGEVWELKKPDGSTVSSPKQIQACSFVEGFLTVNATGLQQGSYFALYIVDAEDASGGAQVLDARFSVAVSSDPTHTQVGVYNSLGIALAATGQDPATFGVLDGGSSVVVRVLPYDVDGISIPTPTDDFDVSITPAAQTPEDADAIADRGVVAQTCDARTLGALQVGGLLPTLFDSVTDDDADISVSGYPVSGILYYLCPVHALVRVPYNISVSVSSQAVDHFLLDSECGSAYVSDGAKCTCGAGEYLDPETESECLPCEPHTYKDVAGDTAMEQELCFDCPIDGMVTTGTGAQNVSECKCSTNSYLRRNNDGHYECRNCKDLAGAGCDGVGFTVASIRLAEDWWRVTNDSEEMLYCTAPGACVGTEDGTSNSWGDALCAKGHAGPLCSVCVGNRFHTFSGRCERCSADALANSYILLTVLAVIATVLVYQAVRVTVVLADRVRNGADADPSKALSLFDHVEKSMLKKAESAVAGVQRRMSAFSLSVRSQRTGGDDDGSDSGGEEEEGGSPRGRRRAVAGGDGAGDGGDDQHTINARGFIVKMKIIFVFFQVVLLFQSSYAISFPSDYLDFLDSLAIFSLDWFEVAQMECAVSGGFASKLYLSCLVPIGICVVLLVIWLSAKQSYKGDVASMRVIENTLINLFLIITYVLFPSLSTTIFTTFVCEEFDDGTNLLRADYDISCESDEYLQLQIFAGIMILVYPLGIPAMYTYFLYSNRDDLNPLRLTPSMPLSDVIVHRETKVNYLKFLFDAFKPKYFWMEVFECFRKLALTGFVVFAYEDSTMQIYLGILVSMLAVMVYCYARPYLFKSNNYFAIFAHTQITVTLIGASMLRYNEAAREADEASTHSSYTNRDIAMVLIVSNLLVLVVGAIMIGYACVHTSERDYLEAGFVSDGKGGYQIDPVATGDGGEDPVRHSLAASVPRVSGGAERPSPAGHASCGGGIEMMDAAQFQKRPAAGRAANNVGEAEEKKTSYTRVTRTHLAQLQPPGAVHGTSPPTASANGLPPPPAPPSNQATESPTAATTNRAVAAPPPAAAAAAESADGPGDGVRFSNPMHQPESPVHTANSSSTLQSAPRRRSQQIYFRPVG